MKTSQVETLRLKVEFYRRALRRTVGADVSAIYQRELTAAEFELAELERRADPEL
jgi:Arc/MetJ family transcription regulator